MKLSKEQTQKIVLGAMLVIGLIYSVIEFLIGPLQGQREAALKDADALDPKIRMAEAQIARTKGLAAQLPASKKLVAQVAAMIPDGAPVAWFPPRLSDYFKRQAIDKVNTRFNKEFPDKEITGYRWLNWGVEIPRADFIHFAAAVADIENGEPLIEIQGLDIEASRDEVQAQQITLTVNSLIRQ
jgi:hypothetical protein